jgi:hypothetical protein
MFRQEISRAEMKGDLELGKGVQARVKVGLAKARRRRTMEGRKDG